MQSADLADEIGRESSGERGGDLALDRLEVVAHRVLLGVVTPAVAARWHKIVSVVRSFEVQCLLV